MDAISNSEDDWVAIRPEWTTVDRIIATRLDPQSVRFRFLSYWGLVLLIVKRQCYSIKFIFFLTGVLLCKVIQSNHLCAFIFCPLPGMENFVYIIAWFVLFSLG